MTHASEERIARVADAIRGYLSEHADAADSEEGIAMWWLPAMGVPAGTCGVAEALDRLARAGVVERRVLPGGRVLYRARSPDAG